MFNKDYAKEIAMAEKFIVSHNRDHKFMGLLRELKNGNYSHSEKWSELFDFCEEYYPGATSGLVIGLAYYLDRDK